MQSWWDVIFIIGVSVFIVVAAVAIDALRDYVEQKNAERIKRKEEKEKFDAWALRMLTIAGLHKNAHAIYRREQGSHRRVRV
ncbi:hypothetical protein SEA_BING_72 [Streptomyces phage Bing]|uniref:Uncharacterized protein n=1 Tax=Streptomyces phage Bing TaxID=2079427 RepID=A0A2L1IWE5_9CAUD|nr:hypothetical protein FDJ31_gp72 [Streptomyces phage Bing]AVD99494.1 hypothetical protein SEA_BING_72 [Streptomyces phage Bing]